MRFRLLTALGALVLNGCASAQLSHNAIDVAGSAGGIEIGQVLSNIQRFYADPNAVPSQVLIGAGQVATLNQLQTNPSYGFDKAKTGIMSATPSSTLMRTIKQAVGLTASDQWSQNWTLAPVTDGNDLRRLAALYRYQVTGDVGRLVREYPMRMQANPEKDAAARPLVPDVEQMSRLFGGANQTGPDLCLRVYLASDAPPDATVSLARYGAGFSNLRITPEAYHNGCLAKFVMLVHDAAGATASAGGGGTGLRILFAPVSPAPQLQ